MESRRAFLKKSGIIGAGALAISMSSSAVMSVLVSGTQDCPLPHYVSGIDNNTINLFTNRLILKGKLYGDKYKSPLKNAKLEIWHADEDGKLDSFYNGVRQTVTTDQDGNYVCETCMPGKLSYKGKTLGKRVFLKATSEDGKVVFTQLYISSQNHAAIDGEHYNYNYVLGEVELPISHSENDNMEVTFNFLV